MVVEYHYGYSNEEAERRVIHHRTIMKHGADKMEGQSFNCYQVMCKRWSDTVRNDIVKETERNAETGKVAAKVTKADTHQQNIEPLLQNNRDTDAMCNLDSFPY